MLNEEEHSNTAAGQHSSLSYVNSRVVALGIGLQRRCKSFDDSKTDRLGVHSIGAEVTSGSDIDNLADRSGCESCTEGSRHGNSYQRRNKQLKDSSSQARR